MSQKILDLLKQYVCEIQKIYDSHLRKIILYGSYARGDYREDSDIHIMILLDISENGFLTIHFMQMLIGKM